MALRIVRSLLTSLLILSLTVPPPGAMACGPDFPQSVFIESERPDLPVIQYAAGEVGIVQPTYKRSYLAVAYLYFSGKPFDASEQKQLVALWNHYLNNEDHGLLDGGGAGESEWNAAVQQIAQIKIPDLRQQSANARFLLVSSPQTYQSYENCLDDAFHSAASTLKERAQQFGPQSPAVQSWLRAQQTVFQNCNSGKGSLPDAADVSLPRVIREDREYQIAAAYFYSGNWDEAEKRFQRIAEDGSSPWRATAALVAARCEIRAATLGPNDDAAEKHLAAADAQLKKIIANPSFRPVKNSAERLHGYVEFRLDPDARLVELSNVIEKRTSPETLGVNLDDYSKLLEATFNSEKITSLRKQSEMTNWISSFEGRGETEERLISIWHNNRSHAWLVAALANARTDTPQLAELLDAAARVPSNSPAYLTVAFHRDRLLAAGGRVDQARLEIDNVLKMPQDRVPASARNLFLALRMKSARDLDEFLEFASRHATSETMSNSGTCQECKPPAEPEFDSDAAMLLTQSFPTQLLAQAAANQRLPENLRRGIAQAAWTRAIMLNQGQIAQTVAPVLSALAPDLAAGLKTYNEESSASDKNFAAVFLMLHQPGLRPYVNPGVDRLTPMGKIDDFRDNWWCTFIHRPSGKTEPGDGSGFPDFDSTYTKLGGPLRQLYPEGRLIPPSFMSEQDRKTADQEWASFANSSSGATWLGQQTIDWAKAHPEDPRVPEALHMVVVATRYGCTDADTGDISKQAFTLLHNRYHNNVWTEKTPYWFK